MSDSWKSKLDVLNHKLASAKALEKHVAKLAGTDSKEKPVEVKAPEKDLSIERYLAKKKVAGEKALIKAITDIPSYKTSEFYHLQLIGRKAQGLEAMKDIKIGSKEFSHSSTLRIAKMRLKQILVGLMADVQKVRKDK